MELREKVERILRESFNPEFLEIDDLEGISGYLVSSTFRGQESIDRQTMIYNALRAALSTEERRSVVLIAALTPEEHLGHATR